MLRRTPSRTYPHVRGEEVASPTVYLTKLDLPPTSVGKRQSLLNVMKSPWTYPHVRGGECPRPSWPS